MQPVPWKRWICFVLSPKQLMMPHLWRINMFTSACEDFHSSFNRPLENYIEGKWIINCSTRGGGGRAPQQARHRMSVVTLKLPPLCYSVCSAFVSIIHLFSSVVKTSLLLLLASTETVTNCNPLGIEKSAKFLNSRVMMNRANGFEFFRSAADKVLLILNEQPSICK